MLFCLIYLPFCGALMYIASCDLHLLYVMFPNASCAHTLAFQHNLEFGIGLMTKLVTFFFLVLFQYMALATYFGGIAVSVMFVYPAIIFILEIVRDMGKLDLSNGHVYTHVIQTYK